MSTPRRDESSFVNWADEPAETVPPSPEQWMSQEKLEQRAQEFEFHGSSLAKNAVAFARAELEKAAEIAQNTPLGYITESEHEKLEAFADKVTAGIRALME